MAAILQVADATKTICWGRGDTDPKSFKITDDAGAVVDISTWTFKLTVNEDLEPADTTNEKFSILGAFVTDGTDGLVAFTPAIGDTDITPGDYFYDIERRISSVNIKTLVKATMQIVQDISK